jgi:signal transduction histidine kinase/CheY-like chemotaxis protein
MPTRKFPIWAGFMRIWAGSLRTRLTFGLCLFILLILGGGSAWTITQQTQALHKAAEDQVREIGRAFAVTGAAAILENRFRFQEALSAYQNNPDILELEVVDPDNLIVAAKHPERTGTVLNDPRWGTSKKSGTEQLSAVIDQFGEPALVFVEPLYDGREIAAWIRIEYSLARIQHEIMLAMWRTIALTLTATLIGFFVIRLVMMRVGAAFNSILAQLEEAFSIFDLSGDVVLFQGSDEKVGKAKRKTDQGEFEQTVTATQVTVGLIKAQSRELLQINVSLDGKVRQRTTELAETRDQALAAVKAKSAFLATMSHEIRTPMNGVIGMTGLLLDTDLTPEQREYAETVRSSGEHLLVIINDILDFSKIEAGKLSLEIIDFDLRTAVDETLDLVAKPAADKGVNLACLVHANVPSALRGDPGRLRQILLNLMSNALKFTARGEVVLTVSLAGAADDSVTVRFEIQDTGIGLSLETQGRLFQPFSQADSSTTRKYGGTGLGLAICKQLTELMGGQIGVESQPGAGSTFWFTVSLATQSPVTQPMDNRAAQDLRGRSLCIVDDHATNRRILESYAMKWGVRCRLAVDGQEALACLRAAAAEGAACDVAIIDMQMPGMDGLELARAIKADPLLASTRLILLTAQGQRGDAQAAQTAGYAAYLTKPIHESRLYECLLAVVTLSVPATPTTLITRHSLAEAKTQGAIKILLVEDNVINQKVATRMLEKLGYRVDVAANGKEALEALGRIDYAAVLMDCQMPEMDGFAATAEIRRREALNVKCETQDEIGKTCEALDVEREASSSTPYPVPRIPHCLPIIAMTANAQAEDRAQCLAAGMDDYISKPVQSKVLADVLARWIPSSPAGSGVQAEGIQADGVKAETTS